MKKISSLLSENDLLLVLSLLVGLACGLAAVLLKTGIELMQEGVEGLCSSWGLLMLVVFKDGKAVAKSVGYRPKSEIAAMVEGAR